ncbi:MAG: MotA/TolQ/ExbB proton channel family protein [Gammaproteobacteria bacterium]|jgi:biopolymer transport protein ExbB/TolQ
MMDFWLSFWSVTSGGGLLMLALFGLALVIYWLSIDTLLTIPGTVRKQESLLAGINTRQDIEVFKNDVLSPIKSRKALIATLVTTAPLVGLLGTVSGMLKTFRGLSTGKGDTFDLVAAGISEAMITTETGLLVAIPATFLIMLIGSRTQMLEHLVEINEKDIGT